MVNLAFAKPRTGLELSHDNVMPKSVRAGARHMDDFPLDTVPLLGLGALLPVAAFVLARSPYVVMAAVSVGVTIVALRLMFGGDLSLDGFVTDDEPSDLEPDPLRGSD